MPLYRRAPASARATRAFFPALVFLAMGLHLPAPGADWPRFRGPDLNGISPETNWFRPWPATGPKILWRASVGTGFSSMAVSQGRLVTMGNAAEADTVFCFDARTGKLLWKHSYPAPLDAKYYEGGPLATPTIDGERVYTMSKRAKVFCFEAASGSVIWQKDLVMELGLNVNEWGLAGSPLVQGNLLVLNVGSAGTALDRTSGKVIWTSGTDATGYASPVPFTSEGKPAVAIFAAKALVAVVPQTGRELWRFPWVTGYDNNNADPVFAGNRCFISTYDRGAALLELRQGRPAAVYTNENMHTHMNACVKLGDYLYGMNGREGRGRPNDFRCLKFHTGQVQWQTTGLGVGSVIAADGKLIIMSETGELVIAEAAPEAFKPLARAQVLGGRCWTPPALADGIIYCRNARGDLVAVEARPDSPAPPLQQADIFTAGQDGYQTFRIPSLLVTPKGTVLAFAEGRKRGPGDAGDIDLVLKRSFDGGETWQPMQIVADDGPNTIGNPCPVIDRDTGTIWLLLTRNLGVDTEKQIMNQTGQGTRTVWVAHSGDEGATWSRPVEITKDVKPANWTWYATGPGVGIQLRNGRLVIPCDHALAGSKLYRAHVIYSDDHGAHWQLGGVVGERCNECQAVELADGTLLMNLRSYHGQHRRAISRSTDGGLSWTEPALDAALIEPVCQASLIRYADIRQPGKFRLIFANPASTRREKMTVRLSDDEGKSWPAARELHGGPAAYSCLAALPDQTIGCLYERGEKEPYEKITFARLSLDWLRKGSVAGP